MNHQQRHPEHSGKREVWLALVAILATGVLVGMNVLLEKLVAHLNPVENALTEKPQLEHPSRTR